MANTVRSRPARWEPLAEAPPATVRSWNPSDGWLACLFTLPTLALLGFVFVFPLLWALALSFTRFSATKPAPPVWISLGNESKLLTDPAVWAAFVTTAQFVLMAVSIELVLGLGLALLRRGTFPGRGVLTTVLLPMMILPARLG